MDTLTIYRNDTPTLKFTCTWKDTAEAIDLSAATLTLKCKTEDFATTIFTKADASFDKANAASGLVEVTLAAADTATAYQHAIAELEAYFSATVRRLTLCRFWLKIVEDIA